MKARQGLAALLVLILSLIFARPAYPSPFESIVSSTATVGPAVFVSPLNTPAPVITPEGLLTSKVRLGFFWMTR